MPTRGVTRERHRWGFTLIELMCVTLLLGVLLASALPSMRRQWMGLRVERAAVDVAQAWRAARTLAVAQDRQVDWVWDAGRRCAWLTVDEPAVPLEPRWIRPWTLPDGVGLTVRQENEPVEPHGRARGAFLDTRGAEPLRSLLLRRGLVATASQQHPPSPASWRRRVERVRFFPDGTAGGAPVTCTINAMGTTLRYDVILDPATGQACARAVANRP